MAGIKGITGMFLRELMIIANLIHCLINKFIENACIDLFSPILLSL